MKDQPDEASASITLTREMSESALKERKLNDVVTRLPVLELLLMHNYRWFFISASSSFMAMNMISIVNGWLVLRLTQDSPLALSYVMLASSIPIITVSLFGGVVADRLPRKWVLVGTQTCLALITLAVGILDITGTVQFWHLLVTAFANAAVWAVNMPTRQAMVTEVVPQHRLVNGIALNTSAANMTRIAGPALAGVLISLIDTAGVYFLIVGLYLLAAVTITRLRSTSPDIRKQRPGVFSDIKEGLSYTAGDRPLRSLIIMAFMPALLGMAYGVLLPAWGREALDVGSDELGVLMSSMGIGALAGSLALSSWKGARWKGIILLASSFIWGVALLGFSCSHSFATAIPLLAVVGFFSTVYSALNMTMIQLLATPAMRGRVMSIVIMTFGLMPLSAVPFGIMAEHTGTATALMLSAILLMGFTAVYSALDPYIRKMD